MKKYSIFFILILAGLFLGSCKYDFILPVETPPVDNGGEPISFATQIVPIFTEKCNSCHNSQAPMLTASVAYAQVVPAYVSTTNPPSSKLYVNSQSGSHYAKVSTAQAALILQWIKEGAKKN